MHGSDDRLLPVDATAHRMPKLLKNLEYHEIVGGPHHIAWTHPDMVNEFLLNFLTK